MITDEIRAELFSCQDLKYRDFHSKLMPDYNKNNIIGVRSPQVRSIARAFSKREDINEFLFELPHKFYEESNVHGFIICGFSDYDKTVKYLDDFLPFIRAKTLIVFGENDKVTPIYMAKKLHKKIKSSKLEIMQDAGHFCFVDKRVEFLTLLAEFLN